MKTKKPDRFERIVLAAIKKQDTPESPSVWLNGPDIVKLLRQEHRWMVRMVKEEKVSGETGTEGDIAYNQALDDVLDRLTRRAK
jgi:hypothetical protein